MNRDVVINTVSDAHQALGLDAPKHPLVAVIRNKNVKNSATFENTKVILNLYSIVLKVDVCGDLKYGLNSYDYQSGTLLFTAPGQVLAYQEIQDSSESKDGWNLVFHPDLIRKSTLSEKIRKYSFFYYRLNEALHLSTEEKQTIEELLEKITKEYSQNLDQHSQHLIISNIELLLHYCIRFYDRQFYTRSNLNSDLISNFEQLVARYYDQKLMTDNGIPNVKYCADQLNLSAKYLSDLLKKETGKTAQEHLHLIIIEKAKNSLLNSTSSISQIGYELGFEYPQYFSNLFKSKTGMSPKEFRKLN